MNQTKDFKYVRRLYECDELYDLKKDPQELVNRIDDKAYRNIVLKMKDRVLKHFMETSDVVPLDADKRWFK